MQVKSQQKIDTMMESKQLSKGAKVAKSFARISNDETLPSKVRRDIVDAALVRASTNLAKSKKFKVTPVHPAPGAVAAWQVEPKKAPTPWAGTTGKFGGISFEPDDLYRAHCPTYDNLPIVSCKVAGENSFLECSCRYCNQFEGPCVHQLAVNAGQMDTPDFGVSRFKDMDRGFLDDFVHERLRWGDPGTQQPTGHVVALRVNRNHHGLPTSSPASVNTGVGGVIVSPTGDDTDVGDDHSGGGAPRKRQRMNAAQTKTMFARLMQESRGNPGRVARVGELMSSLLDDFAYEDNGDGWNMTEDKIEKRTTQHAGNQRGKGGKGGNGNGSKDKGGKGKGRGKGKRKSASPST